jgi:hypothetical protein
MTCRAIRKSIPLLAGDDLGPRKAAKVRTHVAACDACRREAGTYTAARAAVRTFAREDRLPAWTEAEWSSVLRIATEAVMSWPAPAAPVAPASDAPVAPASVRAGARAGGKRIPALRLRPVLAYGLAIAIAAAGAVAVLKKPVLKPAAVFAEIFSPPPATTGSSATTRLPGPMIRKPAGPHLTSVTFDMKDGVLKVLWFFNRDFKLDFYGK